MDDSHLDGGLPSEELETRVDPRKAWLHWKAVSLVTEQGATGLIAVTGAQVYPMAMKAQSFVHRSNPSELWLEMP